MPHKGSLPSDVKTKLVEAYLTGEMSASAIGSTYSIHKRTLHEWVRLYKTRGATGLMPATTNRKYSPETKRMAVEGYLSGAGSLDDLCAKYDISSRKMLQNWVKWYNGHGDFKQPNSGGAIYMIKGRKTTIEERIEIVSHCITNNKDYGKTIDCYGVSYQQIYGWVRKYEKDGADGLTDRRGKRKDEASMTEVENLRLQMENELLKKLEALERGRDID